MLVDLNLTVDANSLTSLYMDGGGRCDDNRKRGLDFSPSGGNNQVESSGSFNSSSVVNVDRNCSNAAATAAPGDEDSCSNNGGGLFGYSFRILNDEQPARKKTTPTVVDEESHADGTIQLFPVGGGGVGGGGLSSMLQCLSSGKQWLDLGGRELEYGGMAEKIVAQVQLQQQQQQKPPVKKNRRGPRSKSSQYRGVTFYRRTGRWESHIWDCGKQVYLGGFDTAHSAARAYDRAAIKFRGIDADINFNVSDYDDDIGQMSNYTKEEFVQILRRQSSGFSRGSSKFRGVTLHKCGRWEARMGQFLGKKAYDMTAIKCNGSEAVTNFEPSSYDEEIISGVKPGDHKLDLNLGIAPPEAPEVKRNSNSASATMKNPPQLSHLPLMGTEVLPTGPSVNPGFFPISKERAMDKRVGAHPSLLNWAWKLQGPYGRENHPLPLFSSAASSGFSSSTITTTPNSAVAASAALGAPPQLYFQNSAIQHYS